MIIYPILFDMAGIVKCMRISTHLRQIERREELYLASVDIMRYIDRRYLYIFMQYMLIPRTIQYVQYKALPFDLHAYAFGPPGFIFVGSVYSGLCVVSHIYMQTVIHIGFNDCALRRMAALVSVVCLLCTCGYTILYIGMIMARVYMLSELAAASKALDYYYSYIVWIALLCAHMCMYSYARRWLRRMLYVFE